jgi:8-oxo-dGTP diphosphatase
MPLASYSCGVQDATLCLPVVDGRVLLVRKKRGVGAGLYNGPGGKIEPGETPRECIHREVNEELRVGLSGVEKVGELDFVFGDEPFMFVHVYRASDISGEPEKTEEAEPQWFDTDEIPYDEMWPDDRHWMPKLLAGETFCGRFRFDDDGDELLGWAMRTDVEF